MIPVPARRNLRRMSFSHISLPLARRVAGVLLAVLAIAFGLVAADQAGAAATGTLRLAVGGVPAKPKKAKRAVTVRAIDLRTGSTTLSRKQARTAVSLKLPSGAYLVAVRAIDVPGKSVEGTSGLAVVKSGRVTRKKFKARPLKKRGKKGKKAGAAASAFAPASESAGLTVYGIDPKTVVKGVSGYPDGLAIDSVLATPLSEGCPGGKPELELVEIRNRQAIIDEIERSNGPGFDKSTAIPRGHLLKERQMVRGGGSVKNGRASVELQFVDLASGKTLTSVSVSGTERELIDLIERAAEQLRENLCAGRVDVTFTGSGTYKRDEGSAAGDSEDHVTANYNWSITYRGVSLDPEAGSINFASTNQVTGSWTTVGRYGASGPGDYQCSAPLAAYSGEFSMTKVELAGGRAKLAVQPYFAAQGDYQHTTCSGLPGPPYASFTTWGGAPANIANVEFALSDLSAGPLTFNVGPQATLAPDCSDLVGGYEAPCTQSSSWSGTVTVTRAAG